MALDFPNSPTNGQFYEGFVWSSASSTWRVTKDPAGAAFQYVVVGGGGGGAGSNTNGDQMPGGGAGGYRSNVPGEMSGGGFPAEMPLSLPSGTYDVVVGTGGAGGTQANYTQGADGTFSRFGPIIAYGGSGGSYPSSGSPNPGGSSGGGPTPVALVGQGFPGQNVGGNGGGGGGAGEAGGTDGSNQGGDGVASSITGSSVTRAGGGGAAVGGVGGDGGGGTGGNSSSGTAGTANTGGGGGGGGLRAGSAGGSGVVILKYADSMTLTISGGLTSSTATSGGFKVTTFTAGTGTVSF